MVRTWLPQQSILAHPKTILFFTHVGNNGLLEAIHYRVPMVGMPIYMNQAKFLALKHASRILGYSSNPVCGFY